MAISDSVHVGFLVPNAWAPPRDNFDSVPTAIMTLAQCMLFKWMAPMQGAKDATAVDVSPNYDSNMMSSLFFVIFIIACGFFGFNLVLAFVVDAYHISKGTEECDRLFARFIQQIEIVRPQSDRGRLPSNRHSTYLRRIFYSQAYAKFVLTCIVVSGVLNLATHSSGHGSSLPDDHDTFELVMEVQQFVFDIELLLEVMLGPAVAVLHELPHVSCVPAVFAGFTCRIRFSSRSPENAVKERTEKGMTRLVDPKTDATLAASHGAARCDRRARKGVVCCALRPKDVVEAEQAQLVAPVLDFASLNI